MTINVKGLDFEASVGGDFSKALDQIKAIEGRKYDAAAKAWIVPMKMDDFEKWMTGFPITGDDGSRVTSYGNIYSAAEWEKKQQAHREDEASNDEYFEKYNADVVALRGRCRELAQGNEKAALTLARLILDGAELTSAQFSTQERYEAALVIQQIWLHGETVAPEVAPVIEEVVVAAPARSFEVTNVGNKAQFLHGERAGERGEIVGFESGVYQVAIEGATVEASPTEIFIIYRESRRSVR